MGMGHTMADRVCSEGWGEYRPTMETCDGSLHHFQIMVALFILSPWINIQMKSLLVDTFIQ